MTLQRRIPKFGFKNPFRKEYDAVNLSRLAELVAAGSVDGSTEINPEVLRGVGLVGKKTMVKILGGGEVDTALTVLAHAFSASAKQKIEAAGGTATVI